LGSTNLKPHLVEISPIHHPKGDLFKVLQKSSSDYLGFGEAYFTTINYGQTKGWKKHRDMYLNLTVPAGVVKFHIYDEVDCSVNEFLLGCKNHGRLFVPPGFWVAFSGVGQDFNLILNIASIEHTPEEAESCDLETFPFINE
jgi:dTDP-4-dehydrorhamnose 3,5-epimerase